MKSHHRLLENQGSAQASAWLQSLGEAPLDELIILPTLDLKSARNERVRQRANSEPMLHAWPNPPNGPVYIVCNVPPTATNARLRILDLNGRLVKDQLLVPGAGIVELLPGVVAGGIYMAELRWDGIQVGRVKLALQ